METTNTPAPAPQTAGGGGKTKLIVGTAVVILFAVAFGLFVYRVMTAGIPGPESFPTTPARQDTGERKNVNPAAPAAPVVNSTDGVVDAISAEADAEMVSVGQELSSEESLAGAEAEALNDLNQSYDETQY